LIAGLVGALWEIWAKSFSPLFISPLTISEFIAGQMIFSLMKEVVLITAVSLVSYSIFGFSILSLGPVVVLYIALLMMFGWAFGCFILGLVLKFGTRIQSLSWGLVYAIQPFIGLYYPVEIFPPFVRYISYALPPTYVYKAMRANLIGTPADGQLMTAFMLNIVYFIVGYIFMNAMWQRARHSGSLARMEE
jgi:ABC-2 type transport system permease protein